jgi:hypothetical protein
LEGKLEEDIAEVLEEKKMLYIASWERRWQQRGIEVGERQGRISMITLQLVRCVGKIDVSLKERIGALSIKQLDKLGIALLDFTQPSDLERWLKRQRNVSSKAK